MTGEGPWRLGVATTVSILASTRASSLGDGFVCVQHAPERGLDACLFYHGLELLTVPLTFTPLIASCRLLVLCMHLHNCSDTGASICYRECLSSLLLHGMQHPEYVFSPIGPKWATVVVGSHCFFILAFPATAAFHVERWWDMMLPEAAVAICRHWGVHEASHNTLQHCMLLRSRMSLVWDEEVK